MIERQTFCDNTQIIPKWNTLTHVKEIKYFKTIGIKRKKLHTASRHLLLRTKEGFYLESVIKDPVCKEKAHHPNCILDFEGYKKNIKGKINKLNT